MTSTSIAKHTPGPAKADLDRVTIGGRYNLCPHVTAGGSSRGMIDEREVACANAARIALTWNCHDELVSALKGVVTAVDHAAYGAALSTARAAIARAEGGKQVCRAVWP